jgi:hypothetical protein
MTQDEIPDYESFLNEMLGAEATVTVTVYWDKFGGWGKGADSKIARISCF